MFILESFGRQPKLKKSIEEKKIYLIVFKWQNIWISDDWNEETLKKAERISNLLKDIPHNGEPIPIIVSFVSIKSTFQAVFLIQSVSFGVFFMILWFVCFRYGLHLYLMFRHNECKKEFKSDKFSEMNKKRRVNN